MKRKKYVTGFLALLFVAAGTTQAGAASVLYDWAFQYNGTTAEHFKSDPMPGYITGSLDASGLGTLTATFTGIGNHNFTAFFDHEIDEGDNTYFNEYGSANGSLASGQSWEIDEPGWTVGDIYAHVLAGALDNSSITGPEDISMAMGWNFTLAAGEQAVIRLFLSDIAPTSGFYLAQTDPDWPSNGASIYFSSSIDITGGGNPVPEPATMLLMGTGLAGLAGMSRRMRRQG